MLCIPKSLLFEYLSLFDLIYFSRTGKQNNNDVRKYANPGLIEIYFVEFGYLLESIFDKIQIKLVGLRNYRCFDSNLYPGLNYHKINKLKKLKIFNPEDDKIANIKLNNNISEIFLNRHFRNYHIKDLLKIEKISLSGSKISPKILKKLKLKEIHFNYVDNNYCNEIIKNTNNLETLCFKNCSSTLHINKSLKKLSIQNDIGISFNIKKEDILYLHNLTELDLCGDILTDEVLINIAEYKKLKKLFITNNNKITKKSLHLFTFLTSLYLYRTNIESSAFEKLENLEELSISNDNKFITDEAFKYLPKLKILWLVQDDTNKENITDQALYYVKDILEDFTLSQGKSTITDTGLSHLTKLKKLNLYINEVLTNKAIENLTNLESLTLDSTKNINGKSLKNLIKLTSFCVGDGDSEKINFDDISQLTNLNYLKIDDIRPINWSVISNLKYLTYFEFHWGFDLSFYKKFYIQKLQK